MYKHNASSIKETQDKQFVSLEEKQRWNNKADNDHTHDDIYYTKSEIDDVILDTAFVDTEDSIINDSYGGFTKNTEIYGRTVQYSETININATMENGAINPANGLNHDIIVDGIVQERYRSQEFIEVQMHDVIKFDVDTYDRLINVFLYNSQKEFIVGSHAATNNITITNTNAKYIRFYYGRYTTASVTLERTHLSDFRSVGNEREDGLFEFDVVCSGKNLAKPCKLLDNSYFLPNETDPNRYASENIISVKPNTKYAFTSKNPTYTKYIVWLDANKKFLYIEGREHSEHGFTTTLEAISSSNARFAQLYVFDDRGLIDRKLEMVTNNWTFMEVLENGEVIKPVPYEEERRKLVLPVQLEGIGDVSDKLFVRDDGVVCVEKRIKTVSNIAEYDWNIHIFETSSTIMNETYIFSVKSDKIEHSRPFMCDKLPYLENGNWGVDIESVFKPEHFSDGTIHDTIHVRLAKSRFGANPTRTDFRNFINSVNFKYISAEPEIIELEYINDLSIPILEGVNNITTNSDVQHDIKCSAPMSITTTVGSQVEKIHNLKEKVNEIQNIVGTNSNLAVEFNDGYKTVTNTGINGMTTDVVIEGDTYVNALDARICQLNPDDFYNSGSSFINNTQGNTVTIDEGGFITVNKTQSERFLDIYPKRKMFNVKSNTQYTYIIEILENTLIRDNAYTNTKCMVVGNSNNLDGDHEGRTIFKLGDAISIAGGQVGVYKYLLTTRDVDNMSDNIIGDRIFVFNNATGKIKFRYSLIEGNHLDNPSINKTFMSICNVSENNELRLKSLNENLFNYEIYPRSHGDANIDIGDDSVRIYNRSANAVTYQYFTFDAQPNTKYTFEMNEPNVVSGVSNVTISPVVDGALVDGNALTPDLKNGKLSTTFTTPSYINDKFRVGIALYATYTDSEKGDVTYSGIKIYKSGLDSENIGKSESHEIATQLSEPLRSTPNGTKDTIEKIGNKYYVVRRCAHILLNGNEDWYKPNNTYDNTNTLLFAIRPSSQIFNNKGFKNRCYFYCSGEVGRMGGLGSTSINNQLFSFGDNVDFRIKRSSLETEDLVGLKRYLQNNPIEAVYELETSIIEPLDIDLNLRVYDDTNFIINYGDTILPNVKLTLPCNLSSTVKTMVDKVQVMENKRHNMIQFLLNSTYEADKTSYRFEILTNNVRNVSLPEDYDLYTMYKYIIEKRDYDRYDLEDRIDFYTVISKFSLEMADELFTLIDEQNEIIEM